MAVLSNRNTFGCFFICLGILLLCEYAEIELVPNWQKLVKVMGRISPNQTYLYHLTNFYPRRLAWILNFNYKPHPEALRTLLHFYARHFEIIVIVSSVGRVGPLLELDVTNFSAEILWSVGCPTNIQMAGGLMMLCYSMGLQILQSHKTFQKVDYVVLSNDDVILNITKVREFARDGLPVSHRAIAKNPPPMFKPPPKNVSSYFQGWNFAKAWPFCQKLFDELPPEYKKRYLERHGDVALLGGVDVFFLPSKSVSEFIFLSNFLYMCWIELGIPLALSVLRIPTTFYSSPSKLFMYRWWGILITPTIFEKEVGNNSIVAFHPFKLSYPEHRLALNRYMIKYKFSE